ncbi:MAG: hypothetical protein K6T83_08325 [Alicyclobacillus sp.]|nr:hypothetical protein [Alicyclobacillus sp.]
MKSTQQWLVPTVSVVTIIIAMPSSFVATNENKVVFEVDMVGTGARATDPAQHEAGTAALAPGALTVAVNRVSEAAPQLGSEQTGEGSDGNLRISTVFHNRWLWLIFQLLAVICVLCSGRITISI